MNLLTRATSPLLLLAACLCSITQCKGGYPTGDSPTAIDPVTESRRKVKKLDKKWFLPLEKAKIGVKNPPLNLPELGIIDSSTSYGKDRVATPKLAAVPAADAVPNLLDDIFESTTPHDDKTPVLEAVVVPIPPVGTPATIETPMELKTVEEPIPSPAAEPLFSLDEGFSPRAPEGNEATTNVAEGKEEPGVDDDFFILGKYGKSLFESDDELLPDDPVSSAKELDHDVPTTPQVEEPVYELPLKFTLEKLGYDIPRKLTAEELGYGTPSKVIAKEDPADDVKPKVVDVVYKTDDVLEPLTADSESKDPPSTTKGAGFSVEVIVPDYEVKCESSPPLQPRPIQFRGSKFARPAPPTPEGPSVVVIPVAPAPKRSILKQIPSDTKKPAQRKRVRFADQIYESIDRVGPLPEASTDKQEEDSGYIPSADLADDQKRSPSKEPDAVTAKGIDASQEVLHGLRGEGIQKPLYGEFEKTLDESLDIAKKGITNGVNNVGSYIKKAGNKTKAVILGAGTAISNLLREAGIYTKYFIIQVRRSAGDGVARLYHRISPN